MINREEEEEEDGFWFWLAPPWFVAHILQISLCLNWATFLGSPFRQRLLLSSTMEIEAR